MIVVRAVWTQLAEQDLADIAFHIAYRDNRPRVAQKIVEEFKSTSDIYAGEPESGKSRSDLGEGYRTFLHKRWVANLL